MREELEAAGASQGFGPEARSGVHPGLVNSKGGPAEVRAHGAAENRRGASEGVAARPGAVGAVVGEREGGGGAGVRVGQRQLPCDR